MESAASHISQKMANMGHPSFFLNSTFLNQEIDDYIPGIFIPDSRFAKLGFDMDLNILRICAY